MASQAKPIVAHQPKAGHSGTATALLPSADFQRTANDLLQKMETVVENVNSYDLDEVPATSFARERIKMVIEAASQWIAIPMGSVLPLDGGVQISWRLADRHLRLFCADSQSGKSYIYKATGSGSKRVSELLDVGAVTLAKHLHWLQHQ